MIHDQIADRASHPCQPVGDPDSHRLAAAAELWSRAAEALARRDYSEFDRVIALFRIDVRP